VSRIGPARRRERCQVELLRSVILGKALVEDRFRRGHDSEESHDPQAHDLMPAGASSESRPCESPGTGPALVRTGPGGITRAPGPRSLGSGAAMTRGNHKSTKPTISCQPGLRRSVVLGRAQVQGRLWCEHDPEESHEHQVHDLLSAGEVRGGLGTAGNDGALGPDTLSQSPADLGPARAHALPHGTVLLDPRAAAVDAVPDRRQREQAACAVHPHCAPRPARRR